jgi:hypothetical protein
LRKSHEMHPPIAPAVCENLGQPKSLSGIAADEVGVLLFVIRVACMGCPRDGIIFRLHGRAFDLFRLLPIGDNLHLEIISGRRNLVFEKLFLGNLNRSRRGGIPAARESEEGNRNPQNCRPREDRAQVSSPVVGAQR